MRLPFDKKTGIRTDVIELSMGPQHPATHGVLRVMLELDGEVIRKAECKIGYLHRGTEKIGESLSYYKFIPYTDRLDYLAPLSNNLAYVMAVEKLIDIEVPRRAQVIRVILAELSRIESHLVWLGSNATDIGATTVFLYAFREREKIYDILEGLTGQRMNNAFLRIGGIAADIDDGFMKKLRKFINEFPDKLNDMEGLLTKNDIWLRRTKGVGILKREEAIEWAITGPILRASGVKYDLRKAEPYLTYENYDFDVPIGKNGDVYDRYLVRMEEMRQSVRIIEQALEDLPEGDVLSNDYKYVPPPKDEVYNSIEAMIHHFVHFGKGFKPPKGEVYQGIEGPKGEIGFYIVSDGTEKPYRVRIRPPSFLNVQLLEKLLPGHLVADAVAIIGSLDPVLGEVDR